uniref:GtrA-like protein domain-containing protein n=1 Tax=Panagrolaimus sp. JU765 TaxID=591449 RepID=A0AC34QY10_9BILA
MKTRHFFVKSLRTVGITISAVEFLLCLILPLTTSAQFSILQVVTNALMSAVLYGPISHGLRPFFRQLTHGYHQNRSMPRITSVLPPTHSRLPSKPFNGIFKNFLDFALLLFSTIFSQQIFVRQFSADFQHAFDWNSGNGNSGQSDFVFRRRQVNCPI